MAEIKLKNVTKKYGAVEVIPPMDLDIKDGEFVVLVGPSGCGKSTTLRMIAGLEEITSGHVFIDSRDVTDVRPGLRNCAMVFQNYALYPHMTVRENIGYGMKSRGAPKDEIKTEVERVAESLDLTPYLDRKPASLSGGQRQRVAIGRAIIRDPDVFLFDEPLSNLDAKLRVEMRLEIKQLHRRLKTTMVYVTHDQVEAMTMADRVVILRDGIVEQSDDPISLYNNPANKFVAEFIGTPSMNMLGGTIENQRGKMVFAIDGGGNIDIPTKRQKALKKYVGERCTLGIRPEHTSETKKAGTNILKLQVVEIEPLGSHSLISSKIGDAGFIAQVDSALKCDVGDDLKIQFDNDKIHFFDDKTSLAIR